MPKIVHIVLWKLREDTEECRTSISRLSQLSAPGRLSCVLSDSVGPAERTQGYNYGMYSVFESMESLKTYAASEEHVRCATDHVKTNSTGSLAFDWEIPEL